MTNFPETENSIPKSKLLFRNSIFFVVIAFFVVSAWFCGDILVQRFIDGGGKKVSSIPKTEAVEGASFKKEVNKVLLEDIFPVEDSVPVRQAAFGDIAFPSAHSSLLLDAQSGVILYHNNGTERRQIASLTKLMTALLVMENVKDLNETVTVTGDIRGVEGTVVGCPRSGYCTGNRLVPGENITVRSLLEAMLMNSTNDAALALGIHISGSEAAFVEKMNQRARDLGLRDTHFCTPSGLEPDGIENTCYSTAYDIARIATKLLPYEEVWKIFQSPPMTIYSVDGKKSHNILNTDQILGTQNIMGVKTGFTPNAGRSLLAVAHNDEGNHPIVAVLLDDPYRWEDIKTMLSWAYGAYRWE